jgi:2-methylisocitrate lyase-like PEP mutase family enzyme
MTTAKRLRELLAAPDMLVAPGAYDGITAKLIEQAGFSALYMTGAGTSASFGLPDYGLLSMTEMVGNAARITAATSLPLISDADTGYGTELNVVRTVREHERAGTAGIHIEDQVSPKRCGHLDGKEVVSREEFVAKIRAAVATRRNPDFVVIARTDARSVLGFEEAILRANAALAAGADMAFVESPQSVEEVGEVPRRVRGPCLLNVVWGGKTPQVDMRDAQAMGYRLAILPGVLLKTVYGACDAALQALKEKHRHPTPLFDASVRDAFRRFGADEWDEIRTRFRDEKAPAEAAE